MLIATIFFQKTLLWSDFYRAAGVAETAHRSVELPEDVFVRGFNKKFTNKAAVLVIRKEEQKESRNVTDFLTFNFTEHEALITQS